MSGFDWLESARASVMQVQSARGGGSAFILSTEAADSVLLTNHHVVSGQTTVTLKAVGGQTQSAEVIASDPALDLALLSSSLPLRTLLPESLLPESGRPRLGDPVFALGHPWGRPWTLTRGVVSGLGPVALGADRSGDYIRSDVQLAPGNSGGPLLNAHGRVVGVNSMVWTGGLGVAVPVWVALAWMATLRLPAVV